MPMTVTVVKIWTIEADQLPVHYPISTSTKYKYKSGCTGLPCSQYMRSFIVSGLSRQTVSAFENTRSSQLGLSYLLYTCGCRA